MKNYQGYIIDLDGTMYLGDQKIDYAADFIDRLRQAGKSFLFLTNNSTKSPEDVAKKLQSFDIEAYPEEVYTSSMATVDYLKSKDYHSLFLIGEGGLKQEIEASGLTRVDQGAEAVVVGLDRQIDYEQFKQASLLIQEGAELVVTNPDRGLPTNQGIIPGSGAFAAFLETASNQKATIIGKPEAIMMEAAVQQLQLDKNQCVMVGDNYDTDILAGINNDIDSLMVFTGLSTREEAASKDKQPTYKVDNLSQWPVE